VADLGLRGDNRTTVHQRREPSMTERPVPTVLPGDPTVDWCRRCQRSRTTVDLWALTVDGMYKIGHRVDCGCYR
jgi:hypothetical protein